MLAFIHVDNPGAVHQAFDAQELRIKRFPDISLEPN
jgi:hypothetical protein